MKNNLLQRQIEFKYINGNELKSKLFITIQFGYVVHDINIWMHAAKCNNKKNKQVLNIKNNQFSKKV